MAFSSPFVDCRVSNPKTGTVFSLSLFGGDEQLPYVQEVRFNLARNVNLGMTIVLSPPYEEALRVVSKESEVLRLGNTVAIRWGYADMEGAISDWSYGFMGQPQVSFGEEITVTVEATGLNWHMDRMSHSRDWASDTPRSVLDVAVEISERYGLEVEYAVTGSRSKELMETERESLVQGGRTDMQFLMFEIERCGGRMILQNQKLFIIDAAAPLPSFPQVNATFGYHAEIDVTNNILPMNSFNTESMGQLFIRNVQGIRSIMYGPNSDPESDMANVGADESSTENNSFSSDQTYAGAQEDGNEAKDMGDVKVKAAIAADHDFDEGGRFYSPPLNGSESEAFFEGQLAATYGDEAGEHGIAIKFSSGIGIPNLLPGMYVRIIGVGDYFSTVYMINELSLAITGDGTNMDLECFSRGFPAADSDLDAISGPAAVSDEPSEGGVDELFLESKVGI